MARARPVTREGRVGFGRVSSYNFHVESDWVGFFSSGENFDLRPTRCTVGRVGFFPCGSDLSGRATHEV
jgi:hypothetical protein